MFTARTIHLDPLHEETATYELTPTNEEGQRVCGLLADFLAGRPAEFREKLPFLKKDLELEWTAAPGGVALASFHDADAPRTMCILLAGLDAEADRMMLQAWRENVVTPLLRDNASMLSEVTERPALVSIVFPGEPDLMPAIQLMTTALASVYFRCMMQLTAQA